MTKITIDRALVDQVLDALETCDAAHISDGGRQWYDSRAVETAIAALRAELAKPKRKARTVKKRLTDDAWEKTRAICS